MMLLLALAAFALAFGWKHSGPRWLALFAVGSGLVFGSTAWKSASPTSTGPVVAQVIGQAVWMLGTIGIAGTVPRRGMKDARSTIVVAASLGALYFGLSLAVALLDVDRVIGGISYVPRGIALAFAWSLFALNSVYVAVLALYPLRVMRAAPDNEAPARSMALVGISLMAFAAFAPALMAAIVRGGFSGPVQVVSFSAASLLVLAAIIPWLWATRGAYPRLARNAVLIGAAMYAAALLVATVINGEQALVTTVGVVRIGAAALLGIAVLRGKIAGLDAKLRFGVSKSALAAIFIAVFFVASEAAQQFFGEALGSQYIGIVAAGALVFAMAPLSRLADRLAAKAVPNAVVHPVDSSAHSTAGFPDNLYRAALRAAMKDGVLTRREEGHLAEIAEGLGIGPRQALRLRDEVEAEARPIVPHPAAR